MKTSKAEKFERQERLSLAGMMISIAISDLAFVAFVVPVA